ncbi:MAG: site-specific integrase [Bacteroidota bacterium]
MGYSIKIVLDTRWKKKDGTFPVKLRVTEGQKTSDYTTVFSLTGEEFYGTGDKKEPQQLRETKNQLKTLAWDANGFAKTLPFNRLCFEAAFLYKHHLVRQRACWSSYSNEGILNFDYSPYIKRIPLFREDHSVTGCISRAYLDYIKYLLQQDRLGSALNYQTSYSSIKRFKGNVRLCDITPGFLFQFEKWMLERGRTLGTVGIQLRALRCIFNEAITEGSIDKKRGYPFGKRKYIIPKVMRKKKAIDIDTIGSIYYYEPETNDEEKARDFWIFCYLANGMNIKDVAALRHKDFDEDSFHFIRAKTAMATRGDPREVTVPLGEEIIAIIEKWGAKDKSPDAYVFPIYNEGMSLYEKHYACRAFVRLINSRMKMIAAKLGIDQKVTTIVSRHSFSTQLKRSGASTEFIQEALGHMDKRTTEYYLGSFEKSVKREFANALMAFKKTES